MTAIAAGSSISISVGDGGSVTVATSGGMATVTVTPNVGSAYSRTLGPTPARHMFGANDLKEGGTVVISNDSAVLDYDFDGGNIGLSAAQAAALADTPSRSRRFGNVLTEGFAGRFTTAATSGNPHTSSLFFELESEFDAVRLIVPNSVTSAITGFAATITSGSAAGTNGAADSLDPTGSSWQAVTWAGASTVTLAAGTSVDAASWTTSDWIQCSSLARSDGGAFPLLWVRVLVPGANANRPAWYFGGITGWESSSNITGRLRRFRSQANTDGVNTIANFTTSSISNFNCTPVYVQYLSRRTGLTVLVIGDSIDAGTSGTTQIGWQDISRAAVSTLTTPVALVSASIAGGNSATWLARLSALIGSVNPDYVMLPGYEVNDQSQPMAQGGIAISRFNASQARKVVTDNGAVPVVRTGIPSSITGTNARIWGVNDSLRRALNAQIVADSGSAQPVMDFDAVLAGSAAASGQIELIPAYTGDGLHTNDAGMAALASGASTPMFRRLLTANFLGA